MLQSLTAVRTKEVAAMTTNGVVVPGWEPNHVENNREFHGWRAGLYMYPCDEAEKERMDMSHQFFLDCRHGKLHDTPVDLDKADTRVLDVGTGTGIWAIDMADKHPNAEVIGIDLVNIQPPSIPENLRFRVPRDYESMWSLGQDSFDLIHLRQTYGGVSSWPDLYHKVLSHLKPGVGYVEQVEIDYEPRCDNGEVPPRLREWSDWMNDATAQGSKPIKYHEQTPEIMRQMGFADVQHKVIKLPLNTWSSDPHERHIGRWWNIILCEGLEALSLGPFTRVYRWPADDVRRLVKELQPLICDRNNQVYHNIHIITARKPARG